MHKLETGSRPAPSEGGAFSFLAAPSFNLAVLGAERSPDFHNLLVLTQDIPGTKPSGTLRRGTVVIPVYRPDAPPVSDGQVVEVIPFGDVTKRSAIVSVLCGSETTPLQTLLAGDGVKHGIAASLKETGLHFTENGEPVKALKAVSRLLESVAGQPTQHTLFSRLDVKPLTSPGIVCENASAFVDLVAALERGIDLPGFGLPEDRLVLPPPSADLRIRSTRYRSEPERPALSTTGLIVRQVQSGIADQLYFNEGLNEIGIFAAGSPHYILRITAEREKRLLALSVSCGEDRICLDTAIAEKLGLKALPPSHLTPITVSPALRNLIVLDLKRMFAGSTFDPSAVSTGLLSPGRAFPVAKDGRLFNIEITLSFQWERDLCSNYGAQVNDGVLRVQMPEGTSFGTFSMRVFPEHGNTDYEPVANGLRQEFLDCCRKH